MPSDRFLHLPAEKRQRIAEAAREEMRCVPYDEVSINKIIKRAGIPRGSFYQYFRDKDDLLDYLLWDYRTALLARLEESLRHSADITTAIVTLFDFTVEYGTAPENIAFCTNVFIQHKMHTVNIQAILQTLREDWQATDFLSKLPPDFFRSTSQQDMEDSLEILIVLFRNGIMEIFQNLADKDETMARFKNKMKLLKEGLFRQAEEI